MEHVVTVHVELPREQAWAFAQLLKRLGWSDCKALAEDEQQIHLMIQGAQRVRAALAEAGIAPR